MLPPSTLTQFLPSQFAVPVITSLPQSCGIHRKVTSLSWVRTCTLTRQMEAAVFTGQFFLQLGCPSLAGDESGTVALVDTKNPDSALSAAVHTRGITGFAFSAHRYGVILAQNVALVIFE